MQAVIRSYFRLHFGDVSTIGEEEAKFSLSKLLKALHNRINCSNFVET
jgi:hypothetical protein